MSVSQLIKDVIGIKPSNVNTNKVDVFNFPLKEIKDYPLDGEGRRKLIARVTPINGELLAEDQLESISDAVQGALNAYDGRIGIYIQSERVDIQENLNNMEKRKQELSSETKLSLIESQKNHLASMTNKSRNILSFYIVYEIKEKNYTTAEQILNDVYMSAKNELEGQEMYVDRLNEFDIKCALYARMNSEQSQIEPCQENWDIPNILPQHCKIHKDGRHLEIENRIYRHFAITYYPETVDNFRWLKKIYNIKGDINISIILNPKSKGKIQKELNKAVREIGAKKLSSENDEVRRQEYEAEEQSAKDMIRDLGSDNVNLYDVNITIGVSGKNMDELNTITSSLRAKISSSYLQSTELKYKEFEPFLTTLPILHENKITKNFVWNLSTRDIASIIPFDSSELMEEKGTLIGENVTSNGLVIADPYGKTYNNPHMAIIADSGSGKTFFIQADVMRHLPYRDTIIMFDVDGNLNFPWATKYRFAPTSDVVSNPFHIRNAVVDSENNYEDGVINVGNFLATKIMDCITFFKWILKDMTPFDEALIEEDIRDTYARVGLTFESKELPKKFCTLSTLEEIMLEKIEDKTKSAKSRESRDNTLSSLNPYIHGAYSTMFNGQTNWEYEFLTIFDVSLLPEAVQKPMYDILLKDAWQFCKKDGIIKPPTKRLYVDEAHEFADPANPQTLKFLSTKLIKQGRKYGVSVVTATQNLPDFLSIARYGQAILDNSFFKVFFRLGETDLPVAKKLYNFSDAEMKILKGNNSKKKSGKGRGIFIAGSQRVVIQTRASKDELEVIDPAQFEEIYGKPSRYIKKAKEIG